MTNEIITSLNLTDSASLRIKNVISNNEDRAAKFRVYVTGGGCSGFQYGFKFDSEAAFDDDIIEFKEFSVLLDSMSYPYLYGATVDYVEDLSGAKFVINNPNAKTTCGCGESFTV
jgi:iron-sulfur cluster insertion protein